MTLKELWQEMPMKSDKGDVHSYLEVYEEILEPYRHTANSVLEIGLFNGASLLLWEKYFTKATVWGVDSSETPHDGMADLRPLLKDHNILILDAEDERQVFPFFFNQRFDVIIEDAGHHVEQQWKIYTIFRNFLAPGGIYIIEDIQDIDKTREGFGKFGEVIDRRHIKGRYDDVICVIR